MVKPNLTRYKLRAQVPTMADAVQLGYHYGGWIAHSNKQDIEWFSLQWTRSEVMLAKQGEFSVDPWGAWENYTN